MHNAATPLGQGEGVAFQTNTETSRRKDLFLQKWGTEYGYNGEIDSIREEEFSRLKGSTYLDHAGAGLHSELQLRKIMEELNSTIHGNPHSQNPSSQQSSEGIRKIREYILQQYNADPKEYSVIFTQGCTASLKLVGECFPWSSASQLYFAINSHNSVIGVREYAAAKGAGFKAIDLDENVDQALNDIDDQGTPSDGVTYNLFIFPGECNFSGVKYPLDIINRIHAKNTPSRKWKVMLDAAALVSTSVLDLSKYPADFVSLSFYKIFGFPSGIGALIVKNDAASLLQKTFFGGGTVLASTSTERFHVLRKGISERFEDGSVAFLSIMGLRHGLEIFDEAKGRLGGMQRVTAHTFALSQYFYQQLSSYKHYNGTPVAIIYGAHEAGDSSVQGPIISFNLRRPNGEWVGYGEVERIASIDNIHLRTGCFCNPGACHSYLDLSASEVKENLEAGHVCWDSNDIMNGKPVGAVRVSLGYMSTFGDIDTMLSFICKYFVEAAPPFVSNHVAEGEALELSAIIVYPIKSCAGFEVTSSGWEIGDHGLLYDREWMVVNPAGSGLNQKSVAELCKVQPTLDISNNQLHIDAPGVDRLSIPLDYYPESEINLKVCGDKGQGLIYQDERIANWFTAVLGTKCTLVRKCPTKLRKTHNRCLPSASRGKKEKEQDESSCLPESNIAFANEAQFLLVSEKSVEDVNQKLIERETGIQVDAKRFRPNFIVKGGVPFQEDTFIKLQIGDQVFSSLGPCSRCKMITIDQKTAQSSKEPLLTLATYRRHKGMILFGLQLVHNLTESRAPNEVHIGPMKVICFAQT